MTLLVLLGKTLGLSVVLYLKVLLPTLMFWSRENGCASDFSHVLAIR